MVAATVTQSENVFLLRDRVSNQLQQQRRKKDRIQLHRQRKTALWNGNKFVIVIPFLRQRRNHRATVRNRLRVKLIVTFLIVREARNTVVSCCRQRKSCRATVKLSPSVALRKILRANVPKNQTFLKYGGNSQKINSAHNLR